jgi:hypothetical protein
VFGVTDARTASPAAAVPALASMTSAHAPMILFRNFTDVLPCVIAVVIDPEFVIAGAPPTNASAMPTLHVRCWCGVCAASAAHTEDARCFGHTVGAEGSGQGVAAGQAKTEVLPRQHPQRADSQSSLALECVGNLDEELPIERFEAVHV